MQLPNMQTTQSSLYKAVGFDWGGVVYNHAVRHTDAAAQFLNIPLEQILAVYYQYNQFINLGNNDLREVWQKIFTVLGRASEANAFFDFYNSLPAGSCNAEVVALVRELQSAGFKTGLLSNCPPSGSAKARANGAADLFEVAMFSCEVGFMKPDPQAFNVLIKKLGVTMPEFIFIDDMPKSLESAVALGFTPILFRSAAQARQELVQLGVIA